MMIWYNTMHKNINEKEGEKHTLLMSLGSLIKQRALQRGSLMAAPCLSSWVANPPSITAQPPALLIRYSRDDLLFSTPMFVFLCVWRFAKRELSVFLCSCCKECNDAGNWGKGWFKTNVNQVYRFMSIYSNKNHISKEILPIAKALMQKKITFQNFMKDPHSVSTTTTKNAITTEKHLNIPSNT